MEQPKQKILNIEVISAPAPELTCFEAYRESVLRLSSKFLPHVPVFLRSCQGLRNLFLKKKEDLRSRTRICRSLSEKLRVGFEVFLAACSKNSGQLKMYDQSKWREVLGIFVEDAGGVAGRLTRVEEWEGEGEQAELRKSLRALNFLLESVFCRKVEGKLLVLEVREIFQSFLDMLQSQKDQSSFQSETNIFSFFDLNFAELESRFLNKDFEQISLKFEVDSLLRFLQQSESAHSSENLAPHKTLSNFFSPEVTPMSPETAFSQTAHAGLGFRHSVKGRKSFGLAPENSGVKRTRPSELICGMGDYEDKENIGNRHNLRSRSNQLGNYSKYRDMKLDHFVARNVRGKQFSRKNMMLELQKFLWQSKSLILSTFSKILKDSVTSVAELNDMESHNNLENTLNRVEKVLSDLGRHSQLIIRKSESGSQKGLKMEFMNLDSLNRQSRVGADRVLHRLQEERFTRSFPGSQLQKTKDKTYQQNSLNIKHLTESNSGLDGEEFEELLSCMMRPIRFVERLESLEKNSSSVIYLMKVESTLLKLQQRFSQMKEIAGQIKSLDALQRNLHTEVLEKFLQIFSEKVSREAKLPQIIEKQKKEMIWGVESKEGWSKFLKELTSETDNADFFLNREEGRQAERREKLEQMEQEEQPQNGVYEMEVEEKGEGQRTEVEEGKNKGRGDGEGDLDELKRTLDMRWKQKEREREEEREIQLRHMRKDKMGRLSERETVKGRDRNWERVREEQKKKERERRGEWEAKQREKELERERKRNERMEREREERDRIRAEIERERNEREDRLAREKREREEQQERERLSREKTEQERKERQERERLERLEREQQETLERERQERERLEQVRLAQERLERERQEQETTRLEQERQEQERKERERLEKEKLQRQKDQQQQLEQERLEQQRLQQEQLDLEKLEQERLEQELLEQQRREQETLEQERLEQEALQEQQKQEQQRREQERQELERLELENLEQERLEKESQEQERLERESQEQKRLEQLERETLEQESVEQKRLEMLKMEAERNQEIQTSTQENQNLEENEKSEEIMSFNEFEEIEEDLDMFASETLPAQINNESNLQELEKSADDTNSANGVMEIKIPENSVSAMITPVAQLKHRPKKGGVRGLRELRELKKSKKTLETSKLSKLSNNPSPRSKEESLFSLDVISDEMVPLLRPRFMMADQLIQSLEELLVNTYSKMNGLFEPMIIERFLFIFQAKIGEFFCDAAMQGRYLGSDVMEQIKAEFENFGKIEDLNTMEFCVIQFPENNEYDLAMAIYDSKTGEFLIIKLPQSEESRFNNSEVMPVNQIHDKLGEFIEKIYNRKVKNFFEHTLDEGLHEALQEFFKSQELRNFSLLFSSFLESGSHELDVAKLRFHFSQLRDYTEEQLQFFLLHHISSQELNLEFENPSMNEVYYVTAEKALEFVSSSDDHSLLLINNDEDTIQENQISHLMSSFFEQTFIEEIKTHNFGLLKVHISETDSLQKYTYFFHIEKVKKEIQIFSTYNRRKEHHPILATFRDYALKNGYQTKAFSFLNRSIVLNENPEVFLGFLIDRQTNTQQGFLETFRELSFNSFFILLGSELGGDMIEMDESLGDYGNSQFDSGKDSLMMEFESSKKGETDMNNANESESFGFDDIDLEDLDDEDSF